MNPVALTFTDLALAASLLILNGAISVAFGLRLERSLAIAAIRMVVQLAAVGFVLKFVFEQTSPAWTALIALVMVLVAGLELLQRQDGSRAAGWPMASATPPCCWSAGLPRSMRSRSSSAPRPGTRRATCCRSWAWCSATLLTSVSLALQTLSEGGRTRAQRHRGPHRARRHAPAGILGRAAQALRTATTPLLNTMAVAGVVTLPGMMAGQILAGADPAEAAKYQIMIMFVLAGASGLGALAAALGCVLLMTDSRHRLRLDRMAPAERRGT